MTNCVVNIIDIRHRISIIIFIVGKYFEKLMKDEHKSH